MMIDKLNDYQSILDDIGMSSNQFEILLHNIFIARTRKMIELKEKMGELELVIFYNELIKAAEAHMEIMEDLYNGKE